MRALPLHLAVEGALHPGAPLGPRLQSVRLAFTRHAEPEMRPVGCGGTTGQSLGKPLASGAPAHTGSLELRVAKAAVRAI